MTEHEKQVIQNILDNAEGLPRTATQMDFFIDNTIIRLQALILDSRRIGKDEWLQIGIDRGYLEVNSK